MSLIKKKRKRFSSLVPYVCLSTYPCNSMLALTETYAEKVMVGVNVFNLKIKEKPFLFSYNTKDYNNSRFLQIGDQF